MFNQQAAKQELARLEARTSRDTRRATGYWRIQPNNYDIPEMNRPPFRVCRECGYAEEGWHATLLARLQKHCKHPARDVVDGRYVPGTNGFISTRDKAMRYVKGHIITQDEMGRLGRYSR